jgi:hypothetical protein
MVVVESVWPPWVDDGGPVNPWHLKCAPLDPTDLDQQWRGVVEPSRGSVTWPGHMGRAGVPPHRAASLKGPNMARGG